MGVAYDRALGLIETIGLVAAIEALDAMAKAAEVVLQGPDRAGAGLYLVSVRGSVGSVRAALEAGARQAARVGTVVGVHIIPKPDDATDAVLPRPPESAKRAPEKASAKRKPDGDGAKPDDARKKKKR